MCGVEVCDLYRQARGNPSLSEYGLVPHDISEDGSLFVIEENYATGESSFHHCYHPYVEGYSAILEEYCNFDDAMLAALAIKFNGMRSCLRDDRIYFAREVLGAKKVNKNV